MRVYDAEPLKRLNGYLIHYLHPRTDAYGEGAQSQS